MHETALCDRGTHCPWLLNRKRTPIRPPASTLRAIAPVNTRGEQTDHGSRGFHQWLPTWLRPLVDEEIE